jgi:putative membrane protein
MIGPVIGLAVLPPAGQAVMLFFLATGLVYPVVRYFFYRYRFGDDELLIRDGVLSRNERRVPYARIQNLDLVQNPLHRMLDVAEVRIETASGNEAEAIMRVLSLDAVEEMRRAIREGASESEVTTDGSVPGEATESGRVLLRLPLGELVRLGLVSNRGMVLVAAVLGFVFQQGDDLVDWERVGPWVAERVPAIEWEWGRLQTAIAAFAGVLLALALLYLLSIALAILRYHGFTLRLVGDYLRSESGLFTRSTATTPRARIQRLRVSSSLLQRAIDRAAIRVDTAGGSGGGEERSGLQGKQWLAPILPRSEVTPLVQVALPEVTPEPAEWRPVAWRAWRRVFRRGVVALLVVSVPLAFLSPWALVSWLLLPLLWIHARRSVAARGWALDEHALHVRSGWVGRQRGIVRLNKIQSVHLRATPFDRRAGMATLLVDTAGSGSDYGVSLPFLDEEVARELAALLFGEASRRTFRWS